MNTDEEKHFLPPYLDFIYGHIYNNPKACKRADNILSCNSKVFFQYKTLIQALNRELNANANVLQ